MNAFSLQTPRLHLRTWQADDQEAFAAINADPEVMLHFPALLNRTESDGLMDRFINHFETHGWGRWAVEERETGKLLGFCGLAIVSFQTPFTPAVEIGWRFARDYWGKRYAFEAAHAAMRDGFERLHLPEIVSFTVPANVRSYRLMQRLGMQPGENFEHPKLPVGHSLREHVLYRITRSQFEENLTY
ncbi:GNAT family N-acetyltransferase [Siphonobacter sp.]|uniref:GNAT family N-acetyltransferase n=1 Tax=Siphonobacter sp. TaxID=1869184 RepID=UPI003B3B0919